MALRLLKRIRDFAEFNNESTIEIKRTIEALNELGVDERGFDELDLAFLRLLCNANGRALGLNTIAAALSEDERTIEDIIEPYLLANGYIERTARGRVATKKSYDLLEMAFKELF